METCSLVAVVDFILLSIWEANEILIKDSHSLFGKSEFTQGFLSDQRAAVEQVFFVIRTNCV